MLTNDDDRVRAGLQVIVQAFAVGIAILLGVGWFLWHRDPPREVPPTAPLLSNLSAAVLGAALVARLVVRKAMTATENGWPQFVVAGAAMIEFGGLFGGVAYLLEGTPLALGVGVVAAALILVLQLPTRDRWQRWTSATRSGADDVQEHYEM